MNKKYIIPELIVIQMEVANQMLAGSTDYKAADVVMGGSADNTAAYGRDFDFDDED